MKRSLSIFVFLLLALAAPAVMAQDCSSTCSPQSDCSTSCTYCADETLHIDTCDNYAYTTCGAAGYACNQTGCTPNFQEISREVQGTYGVGYAWFGCEHHRVEWVTKEDYNHCNTSSYYNYDHYCHDETDGYKYLSQPGGLDCCNGDGPDGLPDSTFTCNHYHHCTG